MGGRLPHLVFGLAISMVLACASGAAAGTSASRFVILVGQGVQSGKTLSEIEVVDRGGRVVSHWATDSTPGTARWSPDGRMIAWTTTTGLFVAQSDGADVRRLAAESKACLPATFGHCNQSGMTFAWSPDSRSLLVGAAGPQQDELLLVNATTGKSSQATAPRRYATFNPVGWLPGSRSFVYRADCCDGEPNGKGCCIYELRVGTTAGGPGRLLYRFPTPTVDFLDEYSLPTLSPNGEWVAFHSNTEMRLVSVQTRRTHDLKHDALPVAWSADSRRVVAFHVGADKVQTVPVAGGSVITLGRGGAATGAPGGEVLITRGSNGNQVWASVGGQPERLLFTLPAGHNLVSINAAPN